MKGKKIVFLSTQLPYPPHSGGVVKSWNFVKHLSQSNSLTVACLLKDQDREHVTAFTSQLRLKEIITEDCAIPRNAITLLKSYVKAPCLNVFRNFSSSFKSKIESTINDCEFLIVDHYEMFQYVPKGCNAIIVLHTHNAEFMLWQRMAELSSNPIQKLLLSIESKRVKKYEKEIIKEADLVFATPSDIDLYNRSGFNSSKFKKTYHLGNDQLLDLPKIAFEDTEECLTFMGTLRWEPNIDGLLWFLNQVFPLILKNNPKCLFYILGKDPDERLKKLAENNSNIIFTGFIEDLDTYLKKTRAYIAPLRFGSGMKVKVLEGLYRGVPSVLTSVAAEGLNLENEKHALINDNPETFAAYCSQLLSDKLLWERLRDNSRILAAKEYTWSKLFQEMDKELEAL